MAIIETLAELTKGQVYGNLEVFKKIFGEDAGEKLSKNNSDFSFWDNGQTVLIYDGRQIIFDCNYTECNHKKQLTSCYGKNGLAFDFEN